MTIRQPELTLPGDIITGQNGILDKAIDEFDKALRINPNLWEAYYAKGQLYEILEFGKSIDNLLKAASLNHGTLLPAILSNSK